MKRVIITGASDGLGLELSKQFIEKGVEVIGISRTKPSIEVKFIKADLTVDSEIENAIKIIKKDFPKFDCLINCAGIMQVAPLNKIDFKKVSESFKVNIIAQIKLVSGLMDL
ncbi:MAG: SDR family NAD(P)-dependent oxidoreductase, partial [archaeon]